MTIGWLGGTELLLFRGTSKTGVPMGVLADSFKARLTEMQARHAESDRKAQESLDRCLEILDQMKQISDKIVED